ncbi:MAG: DUF6489 family protein [Gammaproteobacteria bacterium]
MKITIDIDATPEEVREFFGLPNLKPLQEEFVDMLRDQMKSGMAGTDALNWMKSLWPVQLQTMETVQKAFFEMLSASEKPADAEKTSRRSRE